MKKLILALLVLCALLPLVSANVIISTYSPYVKAANYEHYTPPQGSSVQYHNYYPVREHTTHYTAPTRQETPPYYVAPGVSSNRQIATKSYIGQTSYGPVGSIDVLRDPRFADDVRQGYKRGKFDGAFDAHEGNSFKDSSQAVWHQQAKVLDGADGVYPWNGKTLLVRAQSEQPFEGLAYKLGYAIGYREAYAEMRPLGVRRMISPYGIDVLPFASHQGFSNYPTSFSARFPWRS